MGIYRNIIGICLFCAVVLMLHQKWNYFNLQCIKSEYQYLDPQARTMARIGQVQSVCGELCDTAKEIKQGQFMGSVRAKVSCDTLFSSPILYQQSELPPQSWGQLQPELQQLFNYGGRVTVQDWFLDDSNIGEGRNEATVFTNEQIQGHIDAWLSGNPIDFYNGSNIVSQAADFVGVEDKTILVLGTQMPWVEAVLLSKKPKKIVTLEYGFFISEYPALTFIRPREFRERYLNGTLDTFDAVFSFSSLEHSGLGRYGDPLNPWGDILAVAEAWCVTSKEAKLALSVPTYIEGEDILMYNAARVYGPVMYPFLVSNWDYLWPTAGILLNSSLFLLFIGCKDSIMSSR